MKIDVAHNAYELGTKKTPLFAKLQNRDIYYFSSSNLNSKDWETITQTKKNSYCTHATWEDYCNTRFSVILKAILKKNIGKTLLFLDVHCLES